MIELLGSLLGFGTSFFPSVLEYFQDSKDKKHELAMLDKTKEWEYKEAQVTAEQHNVALELESELESIKGAHKSNVKTGIGFIDGLRGSVRPIITYWFMALYSYSKYTDYTQGAVLWTEPDRAIFATIISFWFGDRIRKYMEANRAGIKQRS